MTTTPDAKSAYLAQADKLREAMRPMLRQVRLLAIHQEVVEEIASAHAKHGPNSRWPDGTGEASAPGIEEIAEGAKRRTDDAAKDGTLTREMILTEEWAEAMAESDPAKLRAELIQVAAMAVDWIADIDERS